MSALKSILATEAILQTRGIIKGPPLLPHATPLASRLLDGFRAGQLAARILRSAVQSQLDTVG